MGVSKTSSWIQRIINWLIIAGVLGLAGYGVFVLMHNIAKPRPLVSIGRASLRAELATTSAQQAKGLEGRKDLPANYAMLFVFDRDEPWGIWMKGMSMPIDVVWLDADKRVVHIVEHMQPDGEPHDTFRPSTPARYVLEMRAGTVAENSIKVGTRASFDLGGDI